jgi:hypothetical protein
VSKTTIFNALDKLVFTYKDVHYEPLQMNDPAFKAARAEYVRRLQNEVLRLGKIPLWIDETNFNLFTSRRKGRSLRGQRARLSRVSPQQGKNLHIIGAILREGFVYTTHIRGAFKAANAND